MCDNNDSCKDKGYDMSEKACANVKISYKKFWLFFGNDKVLKELYFDGSYCLDRGMCSENVGFMNGN
eukprot:CAMPEP_0170483830 /NCGR_PEP_ID=MMETSP0208-20121228/3441_1 /TAXON_ID=197538 /ORGANISM="Strombidium inclinatum, Strain S3" /LENGTH=66 /DNA_ID=CAMNT_0010757005 /DNA_START=145 /DNA_END=348 /DNA_ORIENTATION=-